MKTIFSLISFLLPFCIHGQEIMNINLKNATTISYDVDEIENITFSEKDTPMPPAPTPSSFRLKQVGELLFSYDEEGRCNKVTNVILEYEIGFNHSTGELFSDGMKIGTFKMNEKGYLTEMNQHFEMDGYLYDFSMGFEYDSEGHVIAGKDQEKEVLENGEINSQYSSVASYSWKDGNLVSVLTEYDDIEDGKYYEKLELSYSTIPNALSQTTSAQFGGLSDVGLDVLGWGGLPSKYFVSEYKWERDRVKKVSYTFNQDGTVKTEIIDDDVIDYTYEGSSARKPAPARKFRKLFVSKRNK